MRKLVIVPCSVCAHPLPANWRLNPPSVGTLTDGRVVHRRCKVHAVLGKIDHRYEAGGRTSAESVSIVGGSAEGV